MNEPTQQISQQNKFRLNPKYHARRSSAVVGKQKPCAICGWSKDTAIHMGGGPADWSHPFQPKQEGGAK